MPGVSGTIFCHPFDVYSSSLPTSPLKYGWPVDGLAGRAAVLPKGIPEFDDFLIAINRTSTQLLRLYI
jgi:hypothetical protein